MPSIPYIYVIELRKHRSSHDVLFIICMGLTKFGYAR